MTRRWVQFQMPVMVCVDVHDSDDNIKAAVDSVVVADHDDDIALVRQDDQQVRVYDEDFNPLPAAEPSAAAAIDAADGRCWPGGPRAWPAPSEWQHCHTDRSDQWPWLDDQAELSPDPSPSEPSPSEPSTSDLVGDTPDELATKIVQQPAPTPTV